MVSVTAIFDIGKTNKKFFLFDEEFNEVYKVYHRLDYVQDEDGDPCESLEELTRWIKKTLDEALALPQFLIQKLNFTTYGASLVHVNKDGDPVTPLYNYTKEYPESLLEEFYSKYGGKEQFCRETSSPALGMINSGLQLYWLKYTKPEIFKKIAFSLHLPQYLSFLFTGKMVSDYTSIGCHSGLWDFEKKEYHSWLKEENILQMLPVVKDSTETFSITYRKQAMSVGTGVHDSSAALLPYLKTNKEPFILLSTGTWAISINPFNSSPLTSKELELDCLHFIGINGNPIKISRLFIGEEHKVQIEKLYDHFKLEKGYYKELRFDADLYQKAQLESSERFRFEHLKPELFGLQQAEKTDLSHFSNFEEAYYCFLHELTDLQVASLNLILDSSSVSKIYIDGGFNANDMFVEMLRDKLAPLKVETCDFALGTALGAAILVNKATEDLMITAS